MKKPSERIEEIRDALVVIDGKDPENKMKSYYSAAIMNYLDEVFEK